MCARPRHKGRHGQINTLIGESSTSPGPIGRTRTPPSDKVLCTSGDSKYNGPRSIRAKTFFTVFLMTILMLDAAAGTDRGQTHPLNQDSVLARVRPAQDGEAVGLFVVADGMGGHQAGEVASRLAVETLQEELSWQLEQPDSERTVLMVPAEDNETQQAEQVGQRLQAAVAAANRRIFKYAEENPEQAGNLGTTLTGLFVVGSLGAIANVGDSRTYLWREGEFHQLTQDHSYVASLVREGQLEPDAIYTHPRRNVITRSLGHIAEVEVDIWVLRLQQGDRFLLCSDGLWEMIGNDTALQQFLTGEPDPKTAVAKMIAAANEAGGKDNIGVVVVHVNGQ